MGWSTVLLFVDDLGVAQSHTYIYDEIGKGQFGVDVTGPVDGPQLVVEPAPLQERPEPQERPELQEQPVAAPVEGLIEVTDG